MYNKFGEFNSYEELNAAAADKKAAGDEKALKELAKENGLDEEDANEYMDGLTAELSTPLTAALGKWNVEVADLKPKDIMDDWCNYIRTQILENSEVRIAYRRKDKKIKECMGELLKWSFKNKREVDPDIIKAAGLLNIKGITIGIPGSGTAHKIIREYYLGGAK